MGHEIYRTKLSKFFNGKIYNNLILKINEGKTFLEVA